jgi:hypothetical protein
MRYLLGAHRREARIIAVEIRLSLKSSATKTPLTERSPLISSITTFRLSDHCRFRLGLPSPHSACRTSACLSVTILITDCRIPDGSPARIESCLNFFQSSALRSEPEYSSNQNRVQLGSS